MSLRNSGSKSLLAYLAKRLPPGVVDTTISKSSFFLGGLLSGLSLFVEEKRRREELAMYVLPKGLESAWIMARGKGWVIPFGKLGEPLLTAIGMGMVMVRLLLQLPLSAVLTNTLHIKSTYQASAQLIIWENRILTRCDLCRTTHSIFRGWFAGYCTSSSARTDHRRWRCTHAWATPRMTHTVIVSATVLEC